MRTTVTLEPEVERLLRDDMHRRRCSFKQSLNAAVRAGLAPALKAPLEPFVIKAKPLGLLPGYDPAGFNKLVDDLEIEAVAERMRALDAEYRPQRSRRKAKHATR